MQKLANLIGDASTAMLTSLAPVIAASSTPRPRSRALAMLSSTTIESSTTRPVASARPASDITLRFRPNWPMKKNVVLFSESPSRYLIEVPRDLRQDFETIFGGLPHACVGAVTEQPVLQCIGPDQQPWIDEPLDGLKAAWQTPLM